MPKAFGVLGLALVLALVLGLAPVYSDDIVVDVYRDGVVVRSRIEISMPMNRTASFIAYITMDVESNRTVIEANASGSNLRTSEIETRLVMEGSSRPLNETHVRTLLRGEFSVKSSRGELVVSIDRVEAISSTQLNSSHIVVDLMLRGSGEMKMLVSMLALLELMRSKLEDKLKEAGILLRNLDIDLVNETSARIHLDIVVTPRAFEKTGSVPVPVNVSLPVPPTSMQLAELMKRMRAPANVSLYIYTGRNVAEMRMRISIEKNVNEIARYMLSYIEMLYRSMAISSPSMEIHREAVDRVLDVARYAIEKLRFLPSRGWIGIEGNSSTTVVEFCTPKMIAASGSIEDTLEVLSKIFEKLRGLERSPFFNQLIETVEKRGISIHAGSGVAIVYRGSTTTAVRASIENLSSISITVTETRAPHSAGLLSLHIAVLIILIIAAALAIAFTYRRRA